MKKTTVGIFFIGALVLGLCASVMADTDRSAWINVPFSFYAGDTLLPAGTYQFSMKVKPFEAGTVLRITNKDGSLCEHLYTSRIEGNPSDPQIRLIFNQYGDARFLSKVRGNQLGAEVAKSSKEKKMMASPFQQPPK